MNVINFQFQASEELEDRESLAVIAAQEGQEDSNETIGPDGETFMEKYTRGVSAVETILTLDRYVPRQTRQTVTLEQILFSLFNYLITIACFKICSNNYVSCQC